MNSTKACPKKIMAVGIFEITQEWKELESCGFHHSTENSVGHKSMSNLIGPEVDQSDEFSINISNNSVLKAFFHSILGFHMTI